MPFKKYEFEILNCTQFPVSVSTVGFRLSDSYMKINNAEVGIVNCLFVYLAFQ